MATSDIPTEYKPATKQEFDDFVSSCDNDEGWNVCYENKDGTVKVWDQTSDKSAINIVKLYAVFKEIEAIVLYDVLHDPEYRTVWDENMVEGYNIEQIDATNDVGYYSAKAPLGVANRDFVNERSWRVKDDKEYIIMNHSVIHPNAPRKERICKSQFYQNWIHGPCSRRWRLYTYLFDPNRSKRLDSYLVNQQSYQDVCSQNC